MRKSLESRFRRRVLLPGAIILALTAATCGGALVMAGRGTDEMSVLAQQGEVFRATAKGMDALSVAQESIGLCERCITEAGSQAPDAAWLDANVGTRMFELHDVDETYILDADDRPIYASLGGRNAPPRSYTRIAPEVNRFVDLARGEATRSSGRSNLNERLPGSPPEPLVMPPMAGLSTEPMLLHPTVRTTPAVHHATDLVRIGERVAFVSAMPMARSGPDASGAEAPVLVSLQYLDDLFLRNASQENYLAGVHLADTPEPRPDEASTPLMDSDGVILTTVHWQPMLGGNMVMKALLLPAAGVFGVIALLVFLMSLRMRSLMKVDDEHLAQLEQAHLELQAKEAQAHHLAYHDVLTGLPNRALFNDNADKALLRARHGERMALVLLDLDRFKHVNDKFGHLAGDELIKQVGERLSRSLKGKTSVARLGGDEFALLLKDEDLAQGIGPKLGHILNDLQGPYDLFGNHTHVGASIGVAVAPDNGADRTELFRKADIALYRAKEEGRNCYRFFTPSMDYTVQLRAVLEEDLRSSLNSGEGLSVHYQPLIGSDGSAIIGFEALVRWDHPERGAIAPQLFVPVAEETGLIVALGEWVLTESCKVACEWPNMTIAINLSPVQFYDEGFAERISEIVREAGVSPHQIEFEVTEGVVLDKNESVRGSLQRLRQEGFCIALDDFGTGYSSLNYLRDFEVDRIKIDKSFVHSLGQTMDADAIVTAVVTLGRAMGLQVTAEGVETSAQETFLRAAGCNVLQGYLFSRAVPAAELGSILPNRNGARAA